MTKEEVLAMEAGRELDLLVAEEIFGIEVEWDYSPLDLNHVLPKLPFRKGESRVAIDPSAHGVENTICKYSTDIAAVWPVVEKLSPLIVQIAHYPSRSSHTAWVIEDRNGSFTVAEVEAKTAPEAICKAALLAKLEVEK